MSMERNKRLSLRMERTRRAGDLSGDRSWAFGGIRVNALATPQRNEKSRAH